MKITAVIPSIPPRADMLRRALASVCDQDYPAAAISAAIDLDHDGAGITRHRALMAATTEWVAFLDDDDEWLPDHLASLAAEAERTGADYVYSYYQIMRMGQPCPDYVLGHFGKPWDDDEPRQTTITTLVRTEIAQKAGFADIQDGRLIGGQRYGEDFAFTLRCRDLGARFVHLPKITWNWHHHGANTSGRPDRW